MPINSHISWSGCFSWHTKGHRAFDESLRSGCVTANELKRAKTCFQPGKVLPLIETIKRGKGWPWPYRSWAGNRIIILLDTIPSAVGVVTLFPRTERDQSPCRGCPGGGACSEPREAPWRSLEPSWLQELPWDGPLASWPKIGMEGKSLWRFFCLGKREDSPFKESHLVPYFLSLPWVSWVGSGGAGRFPKGSISLCESWALLRCPQPSARVCTTAEHCHLLTGVTGWEHLNSCPLRWQLFG